MKRIAIVVVGLFFIMAEASFAQTKTYIVFAIEQARSVEVSLIKKPDYVSVPVKITSEQKDPELRFQEIGQARQTLLQEIEKDKRITVNKGPVYLSPVSKSLLKSSYYSDESSQANVYLLMPLNKGDVFRTASEIAKRVKEIKAPGKASYNMSSIKLGVENPESYRTEIMNLINKDIMKIKETLKSKAKFALRGLESPVLVRQVDDTQVELFIDYQLSIETD
jgi:hypothetical protein